MTELERQTILKKMNDDRLRYLGNQELLKRKYDELKNLSQDPLIIQYFSLLEEIKELETAHPCLDLSNPENMLAAFKKIMLDRYSSCTHDIWLYGGSHELHEDRWSGTREVLTNKERSKHFRFNEYYCLECGESLSTSDWQTFERIHFVLKNPSKIGRQNAIYYQNLYFQLLFSHPLDEARRILIEAFESKEHTKSLQKEK